MANIYLYSFRNFDFFSPTDFFTPVTCVAGDVTRLPSDVSSPGAHARAPGVDAGAPVHSDGEPLPEGQHARALCGQCVPHPVAGGQGERGAEDAAPAREEHQGGLAARSVHILENYLVNLPNSC